MGSINKIIIFLFLVFVNEVSLKDCEPHIKIPNGSMVGNKFKTNKNTTFYGFLDIPYAIPPVGPLRFQESQPMGKWNTTLNATENKKVCIQFNPRSGDPRENEDCLVLNVYVPQKTFCQQKRTSLPVLIWIHGGSFRSGFGAMNVFGPHHFIDENIIVVSINYRLGPLGFLSTGDDVIPGNLALKDQQIAIKWVSTKIKYFGGDPKRITLMGQSSGAMCVGYHLSNPTNKGIISAAIMHSGSQLSCAALQKYPKEAAYILASQIDKDFKDTNSSQNVLKLLQGASLGDLKNYSFTMQMPDNKLNCQGPTALSWTPTKEPNNAKNPIVTGMNYEKVKKGLTLKIPLLIGFTSQESIFRGTIGLDTMASVYDQLPSYMINGNVNMAEKNKTAAGAALRSLYTNTTFSSNLINLVDYNSDSYLAVPTATYGYFHSKHADVYAYRFAFKGILGQLNSTLPGVGHGEDLYYLFQNKINEDLSKFSKDEVTTHERMVALWSQFIKYRNPTKYTNDLLQMVHWPKFKTEKSSYLNINKDLSVRENPTKFKEWLKIFGNFASPKIDTF